MSAFLTGPLTIHRQQRIGVFARSTDMGRINRDMLRSTLTSTALIPASRPTRYSLGFTPLSATIRQGAGGAPGTENRPTQTGVATAIEAAIAEAMTAAVMSNYLEAAVA
jgi:hypothetical protein